MRVMLLAGALLIIAVLIWQGYSSAGNPDPLNRRIGIEAATLNIGVLVFREGLESILVLAAIAAGLVGSRRQYQRSIAHGAAIGLGATIATWFLALRIIDALSTNVSALGLQAATGLLAVIVLIVVMNWFFHRTYWTGWISLHTQRKQHLLERAEDPQSPNPRIVWGMGLLGFTSLYREGFEVVLFLQSYRLKLGGMPVLWGALFGVMLSSIVALLTFVAHRRLPYRRMLVLTGVLLGVVLLVMVGEEAQEMQLAHWLPTSTIPSLAAILPGWMGLWFAVFPTVETLAAQGIAAGLVLGSYFVARRPIRGNGSRSERVRAPLF